MQVTARVDEQTHTLKEQIRSKLGGAKYEEIYRFL